LAGGASQSCDLFWVLLGGQRLARIQQLFCSSSLSICHVASPQPDRCDHYSSAVTQCTEVFHNPPMNALCSKRVWFHAKRKGLGPLRQISKLRLWARPVCGWLSNRWWFGVWTVATAFFFSGNLPVVYGFCLRSHHTYLSCGAQANKGHWNAQV